jgi:hypothetical protein
MTTQHLNQHQLAKRWGVCQKTLENWRWRSEGPAYLKLGGRIMYRLEDIEKFEASSLKNNQPHHSNK